MTKHGGGHYRRLINSKQDSAIFKAMYKIVFDPSGDYNRGAMISSSDMLPTLANFGFSIGTILRQGDEFYKIVGDKRRIYIQMISQAQANEGRDPKFGV